jgi:outer membrane lipase/esterase
VLTYVYKIIACILFFWMMVANALFAIPFRHISQVYFFGDSLTDSGFNNNFTNANGFPNKAPTFTTYQGYTWAQYVARDIKGYPLPPPTGPFPVSNQVDKITNNTTPMIFNSFNYVIPNLTGIDYAAGGSRTNANPGVTFTWAPSLHQQIQHYLSTAPLRLDPRALYFIWSGANDILAALERQPMPTQIQLIQVADTTTTEIANEVASLIARGATRIVVLSLPNLASSPFVNGLAIVLRDRTIPARMKNLSFIFNSLLNQKLGVLMKYSFANILYFDTYTALDGVIDNARAGRPTIVSGQAFYFVNTTTPVCGVNVSAIMCPNTSLGHVFADAVHPTDETHRILSLEIERRIRLWA